MDVLNIFCWDETKASVAKLQKLLLCGICGNTPNDPMILPACQHSFCCSCLDSHHSGGVCPLCGVTALPSDIRPDRVTAELAAAAEDLRKLLHGEQPLNFSPKEELDLPDKDDKCAVDSELNALTNASTLSNAPQRPKPIFKTNAGSLSSLVLPSSSSSGHCTAHKAATTEPPFTPPINIAPLPSALINNNYATGYTFPITPKTKHNTRSGDTTGCSDVPPATPKMDKRNTKGETALHVACVKGEEATVQRLLAEGANPNTRDHAGWTPLHEACQHGHVSIAEQLLHAGALVNVPGYEGNTTPLHDAVEHGREAVIVVLRRYGARDDVRDIHGNTPRAVASLCPGSRELLAALNTPPDAGLISSVRVVPPLQRSIVITSSNLEAAHTRLLQSFVKTFRVRLLQEYSPDVTHVVVGCEGTRRVCLRTGKFMLGVVGGKWIVSQHWLHDSLAARTLVSPALYEVTGSTQNATSGAPELARKGTEDMLPGLLSGCHVYLHGTFGSDGPKKRELEALVRAGGGTLLHREPNPEAIPPGERTVPYHASSDSPLARCSHYIIYQEGGTEPKIKYDMAHIKTQPLAWLIDCIDHFKLLPPFEGV